MSRAGTDPVEGGFVAASVVGVSAGLLEAIAGSGEPGAAAQAARLRRRAAALGEENRGAHRAAVEALATRGGDTRLGARLERAAALPLAIVDAAADVAELAAYVAARVDPDVRADAVVAARLAEGAAAAAAQLVTVNLAVGPADARLEALEGALARAREAASGAAALSA